MEFDLEIFLENNIKHKTFFKKKSSFYSRSTEERVPALFLDRDGVIIRDCNYIKSPRDVKILDGAASLISFFKSIGWKVIIVSNQSGIFRGLLKWDDYERVNIRMIELLDLQLNIDAIYANGNGPSSDRNTWRKPNPHMLFEAGKDFNINLEESILIGDRISDLIAGNRAGIELLIHVLTGHGRNERQDVIKLSDNLLRKNYNVGKENQNFNCQKRVILIKTLLEFDFSDFIFYN